MKNKNNSDGKTYTTYCDSPIGPIEIIGMQDRLISVSFSDQEMSKNRFAPGIVKECRKQIAEYFAGKRKQFSLPLLLQGTIFQKSVWQELTRIPYGTVASYKQVAQGIGRSKAVRAVGNATGNNPFSIIIPCHRVVGSNGHLTGFGGGLWRKEWLLQHEGLHLKIKPGGTFIQKSFIEY